MDKVLKLYKLVNGVGETFPIDDEQIIISDFVYNAKRMGAAPTITCTIKHPLSLNGEWSEEVYVRFNDENFYLHRTPSSTYDNTDVRYKYELEFISERVILDNVYFFDVTANTSYRGASNTTSFTFSGDIHEFAQRLRYSLLYSQLDYTVVVDKDVTSEDKHLTFTDQFFSNVLQEVYNTYNLPYYFKGKTIHIGFEDTDTALDVLLQYGANDGLLSITKQNANHKVVNRITGVGSSENIPYYYPNPTPKGSVALRANDGNEHLVESDLTISNATLMASRLELNNSVVFTKFEPNTLTKSITEVTCYYADGTNESITGVYTKQVNLTDENDKLLALLPEDMSPWRDIDVPVDSDFYFGKKVTCKFHVAVSFSTTNTTPSVLRLVWERYPYYPSLETQIKEFGDREMKVFEDLEAYEYRDAAMSQTTSLTVNKVGEYPSLYLDIPFIGRPNSSGGLDVTIHLKFTFWKHCLDAVTSIDDILTTTFKSITLANADQGVSYSWVGTRFASSDIKDFGVALSESAAAAITQNPDTYIGEGFWLEQIGEFAPMPNLMPYKYIESHVLNPDSEDKDRFYNALNETYKHPNEGYYEFENPYVPGKPKEHIQNFEDIKPTIVGMVNTAGQPYNQFLQIAYDEGDNDEIDETTEQPLHPYFYVKLPKYDGDGQFNLFDHASEAGAMTISMTSGRCSACNFEIVVDENTQKNKVLVREDGSLVRDEHGRVKMGTPLDRQNDTIHNEVWIALKKDVTTYPSTMPNDGVYNKPSITDTFVITNILLPSGYLRAAERRLEDALIQYMAENNSEKYNFSVKFSRIYLEEHPEILAKITENSSVRIWYQEREYALYISSFTYKMTSTALLPEISVELADTLTIQKNAVANVVGQAKNELLDVIASANFVRQGIPYFLRKDVDDEARGRIHFHKGIDSSSSASFGEFVENTQGAGIFQDDSGNWHMEADYMRVRKKLSAKTVEIEEAHHIGGQQLLTAAKAAIAYVRELPNYYRCYFLKEDTNGNSINNQWMIGDQAYCQYFNIVGYVEGKGEQLVNRFYWRKVVATSNTTTDDVDTIRLDGEVVLTTLYHFVDLSKVEGEYAENSDTPLPSDHIVQLGYQGEEEENKSRQNAIILAGSGEGSPYIQQFVGINTFSLEGCLETQIKPNENILSGNTKFKTYEAKTEEEEDKFKTLDEFNKEFEGLESGVANLIKNSGFVGDYNTADLQEATSLREAFETFSPTLEHWEYTNASAQESSYSQSGKEVFVPANESLSQNIVDYIRANETYTLSFYAQGDPIFVTLGGTTQEATLATPTEEDDETTDNENEAQEVQEGDSVTWQRYIIHIITSSADNKLSLQAVSNTCLCDLMLTKGTLTAAWTLSPLDNITAVANFEKTEYLRSLLKVNTEIDGGEIVTGIINAGLIEMGNVSDEGKLTEKTSGISGIYNNNNSVAFWAGNDYEAAVAAVMAYDKDPKYQPTEAELANMAKAVITHGGRAIMQDIILRGYVYAEGGVFRGKVYAEDGMFNGTVNATGGVFNGTVNAQGGSFEQDILLNGTITARGTGNARFNSVCIDGASQKIKFTGPSKVADDWGTPAVDAVEQVYIQFYTGEVQLRQDGTRWINAGIHIDSPNSKYYTSITNSQIDVSGISLIPRDNGIMFSHEGTTSIGGGWSDFSGYVSMRGLPTSEDGLLSGMLYRDGDTLKIKV